MKFPFPLALLCIVLFAASAPGAAAGGRVGEAAVRVTPNGAPCFTIAEREEQRGGTPNFHSVTVLDGGGRVAWTMTMPSERTFPVTYSMCIPYAGRVQALPQTPAARLEPDQPYRVRIEARRAKGAARPGAYEARFCLARRPDGSTVVQAAPRAAGRKRGGCAGQPA